MKINSTFFVQFWCLVTIISGIGFHSSIGAQTILVDYEVVDSLELSHSKYFKKELVKSSFNLENTLRKKRIEWINKGFFLVSFEMIKKTETNF